MVKPNLHRHVRRSVIALTMTAAIATTAIVEMQPANAAPVRPASGVSNPSDITWECTVLLIEKLLGQAWVACPPGQL